MKPLSLAGVCSGPASPGGGVGIGFTMRRGNGLEILDPPIGADVLPLRPVGVHLRQALGRDRGDPGVEAMRREVEGALHQLRDRLAVEPCEIGQAGAELAERRQRRRREAGLRLEELADRAAAGDGQRALQLTPPVIGLRRAGDEIDELGVAEQRHRGRRRSRRPAAARRRRRSPAAGRGAAACAAGWCRQSVRQEPDGRQSAARCAECASSVEM